MPKQFSSSPSAKPNELLSGFIRLHILHHAAEEPVVGIWMLQELARHGYKIGPGTLYPMLHGMERKGYLQSVSKKEGRRSWREYRTTRAGDRALLDAGERLRELFEELVVDSPKKPGEKKWKWKRKRNTGQKKEAI